MNSDYSYPKIKKIDDLFESFSMNDTKLDKVFVVACQHLLEPQRVMFEHLISKGFLAKNIFILGKAYSSNASIVNELTEMGIYVIQPSYNPRISFDIQHAQNCDDIFRKVIGEMSGLEKLVVLDDGGVLLSRALKESDTSRFIGIEQTSSGFRKLESQNVSFPIFNVARSNIKLEKETPFIVDVGLPRIFQAATSFGIQKPRFLIVGLGPIGLEIQKRLSEDFFVIGYDKLNGEQNITQIIKESAINTVIGATGAQIISHDEIVELNNSTKTRLILVSMSSSDREFEVWKLRDMFNVENQLHDDISFENITILNGGFPITFKGNRLEAKAEWIENTICLLYSGVLLGISSDSLDKRIISIPDSITSLL